MPRKGFLGAEAHEGKACGEGVWGKTKTDKGRYKESRGQWWVAGCRSEARAVGTPKGTLRGWP